MQIAWLNDQQPLLSVFVADGAGSVSQGGEGAMLAVNEAMAYGRCEQVPDMRSSYSSGAHPRGTS